MEILIVDSSIQIIERLAEILSEVKNIKTIHRAASYAQAAELFSKENPDVVLMETGLSDNKSVNLLKEVKATNANIVVIVLSIHVDVLTKQKYISSGADFYLDKYHEFEKIPVIIKTIATREKK